MQYRDKAKIELKNSSYVPVLRDSTVYYGGSQMWFSNANKRSKDYIIHHYGCGTIATADLFLYLALRKNAYPSGVTESVLQGTDSAYYKDYMSYVRKINIYYTKAKRYIAVLGPRIAYAFNSYARTYQFPLRAKWNLSLTYYDMLDQIEEMLARDIPVILSIGPNIPLWWKNEGINFYKREISYEKDDIYHTKASSDYEGSLAYPTLYQYHQVKNNINSHYVTVTGLYRTEPNVDGHQENTDVKEKIMLRISSWGKPFYIDYNEYRDYIDKSGSKFTSSMIYIR